jgi:hypothetical protein
MLDTEHVAAMIDQQTTAACAAVAVQCSGTVARPGRTVRSRRWTPAAHWALYGSIQASIGKAARSPIEAPKWLHEAEPEIVPLLRLAIGPERPQLAAAHRSENSDDFPGRQDGPVKGMAV